MGHWKTWNTQKLVEFHFFPHLLVWLSSKSPKPIAMAGNPPICKFRLLKKVYLIKGGCKKITEPCWLAAANSWPPHAGILQSLCHPFSPSRMNPYSICSLLSLFLSSQIHCEALILNTAHDFLTWIGPGSHPPSPFLPWKTQHPHLFLRPILLFDSISPYLLGHLIPFIKPLWQIL